MESSDLTAEDRIVEAETAESARAKFAEAHGVYGTYHQVGKHHLHRYLSEFDFRYNARKMSDGQRTDLALSQCEGKRLQLRES